MSLPNDLACKVHAEEKQKRVHIVEFTLDILDSIVDWVCDVSNIPKEIFYSKSQKRYIVIVRAAYIKIAMRKTEKSSVEIGLKINKDHATVLWHNKHEHKGVMDIVNQII